MIYFITFNELVTSYVVSGNVFQEDVMPYGKDAYENHIENYLGSTFAGDLLTKYNANSLNANELLLVERIKPIIGWQMVVDSVVSATYSFKNKGLQKQSGEYSESVSKDEVGYLVNHYSDKRNNAMARLELFLKTNKGLFPLYKSSGEVSPSCESSDDIQMFIV